MVLGVSGACAALLIYVDARRLVRADIPPPGCCSHVVVLSSGVGLDSSIGRADHDRFSTAIPLARRLDAGLVTTRMRAGETGPTSDYAQRRVILRAAFDSSRWTIAPAFVQSTRDEALATRSILEAARPIAVVTSPLHTRRACATFERVGFHVVCVPSRETAPLRLRVFSYFRERAATAKYKMKSWI